MSERPGQKDVDREDVERADVDRVLPEQTSDDTDRGWGEHPADEVDDDERLLREKPPHW